MESILNLRNFALEGATMILYICFFFRLSYQHGRKYITALSFSQLACVAGGIV